MPNNFKQWWWNDCATTCSTHMLHVSLHGNPNYWIHNWGFCSASADQKEQCRCLGLDWQGMRNYGKRPSPNGWNSDWGSSAIHQRIDFKEKAILRRNCGPGLGSTQEKLDSTWSSNWRTMDLDLAVSQHRRWKGASPTPMKHIFHHGVLGFNGRN